MVSVAISREWYNEIKDCVKIESPYFYIKNNRNYVEVDVELESFNKISLELGWIN